MSTAIATREARPPATLGDSLRPMIADLARAVPNFNLERAIALVNTIAHRTPLLASCSPASLVASLTQVVSLGLDLAPGRNEAHLIPRWNSQIKGYECSFMPGYKGLEKLATSTGVVHYLTPKDVREADQLLVEHVDEKTHLRHVIDYKAERGRVTHVYTVAKLFDGNITIEVMSVADVEEIHHRSEGWKKAQSDGREETGPWAKDWLEMAYKTCVKRHAKRLPRTTVPGREAAWSALQTAIDADNVIYPAEVEPPHHATHFNNGTGYGRTQAYADPATTNEFRIWVSGFVDEVNAKWLDRHTDANGEVLEGVKDLLSTYQVSNHLVKWAVAEGLIQAPTDGGKAGQRDKFAAAAWMKNRAAVITEAEDYGRSKWKEAKRLLMARETKDVPEGPAEPEGADPHDVDYPPEPGSNG